MTMLILEKTIGPRSCVVEGKQLFAYLLVGVINTAICLGTYGVFILVFFTSFWEANFAAFITSVTIGYILNRKFVFKRSNRTMTSESWRYFVVISLQFIVATAFIGIFVSLGVSEISSYCLTMPFVVLISFLVQKYWTFKSSPLTDDALGFL